MAEAADLVYFSCLGESGPIPVTGWVVDLLSEDVVVGTAPLKGVANIAKGKSGSVEVCFIRVRNSAVSLELPEGWTGLKAGLIPSLHTCQTAWKQAKENELASSEAEPSTTRWTRVPSRKGLSRDMANLRGLFTTGMDEGDDTEDDDEDVPGPRARSSYLPPGGSKPLAAQSKKATVEEDKDDFDVKKMITAGLSSGQSPSEMMPIMLMAMLMDKDSKKKKKKEGPSQRIAGRLGAPWWFRLRQQRRRRVEGPGHESRDHPQPASPSGAGSSSKDLRALRERGSRRARSGPRPVVDPEGLRQTPAVGQVQRHISLRDHGRGCLRVHPLRTARKRRSSIDSESQGQDAKCFAGRGLVIGMAAHRTSRSSSSSRVRRVSGGDGDCVGVCRRASQTPEASAGGEGKAAADTRRTRTAMAPPRGRARRSDP